MQKHARCDHQLKAPVLLRARTYPLRSIRRRFVLALALDLDHVYVIRHTVCLLEEEYDCGRGWRAATQSPGIAR